jgi:glutamate dehydrogenase (NAD(P)+)
VIIAVADAQGLILNQDGVGVERLLEARDEFGIVDRLALGDDDRELPRDEWIAVECDVLVPAAVADAIDLTNCERVRTRLVVEAANLPTAPGADARLFARGVPIVPDFVANSATNGWAWWLALGSIAPTAEAAFARIGEVIPRLVDEVFDRAAATGAAPREAARQIARERLDRLTAEHGVEGPLRLAVL